MPNREPIKLLDHGYLRYVEHWGKGDADINEAAIIEAARQSTQGSFRQWAPYWLCERCGIWDESGPNLIASVIPRPQCRTPNLKWVARDPADPSLSPKYFITHPDHDWKEYKNGDEGLLNFLFSGKPQHATPFEFCGMTIEVQAPIAVFREWHRHRTQCLAGDTMICCVSPRGTTYQRSIKSLFELKYGGVIDSAPKRHRNGYSKIGTPVFRDARRKDAWRVRVLPNCQNRTLRVLNEETGEFTTGQMADVWESGVKEVFLLETIKGFSVRASADHPFWTRDGWVKMKDILPGMEVARMGKVALNERPIPPALRQGIGVWTSMMRSRLIRERDQCYICRETFKREDLILDHVIPVSQSLITALDERNLKPACIGCSRQKTNTEQPSREGMSGRGIRWERVKKEAPKLIGEEMTYDLEVAGDHHNYVANDLVVHNSYNEMSARYAPLPNLNYVPTEDRLFLTSTKNKQAGTMKGAVELTADAAMRWLKRLEYAYEVCENVYQEGLVWGVPKEIARLSVPVGRYSRMRASANLRNWLAFLTLRSDPAAQHEIRQFADALGQQIIAECFPRTWGLFQKAQRE